MYFILRNHILQTTIFIVLLSWFINPTCTFWIFPNTYFYFLANIHIITRYYFCHQNQFYMIILNHIDFKNYNTHVSFSHVSLKILIVFAWSIFLQIAFKHWWNINVWSISTNILFPMANDLYVVNLSQIYFGASTH